MKIHVKILSGNVVDLDVNDGVTVNQIKTILEEKTGTPKVDMILLFSGKSLKNDSLLKDTPVKDGSRLYLASKTAAKKPSSSQPSSIHPQANGRIGENPASSQGHSGRFHTLLHQFLMKYFSNEEAAQVVHLASEEMKFQARQTALADTDDRV